MIHTIQSVPIYQETLSFDLNKESLDNIDMSFKPANNNYFSKNNKILDLTVLSKIKSIVNATITNFQKNIICIEQELYVTDSWICKTTAKGCHARHIHPNSLFSGVVYLQTPIESKINFHHENNLFKSFNLDYNFTKLNEFNSKNVSLYVKNNDIIIFPSWLEHSVDINTSNEDRIILGFNIFVRGIFGNQEYPTRLIL